jgi:hypothetical protein
MNLHSIAALFDREPVATTLLLLLVTITAVAVCVAVSFGACTGYDAMKRKREERLRDALAPR